MAALGMQPAQVEYLSNEAPFVVFDVSPRSLSAQDAARGVSQVSLSYVAVDALSRVEVSTFTRSGPAGEVQVHGLPVRIDDLAQHHASAAEHVPEVRRLHLCGEPTLAERIACAHQAGDAHARIDNWAEALPWLLEELKKETPALKQRSGRADKETA